MRAAIDVVPVDFTEFDRDGRLVLANQAARQSNPWAVGGEGKTLREILEGTVTRFKDVEPERDWKSWVDEQVMFFDRAVTQEVRRPNGDWKRVYYADMPGGGRVVLRVDISEIKRREELLEASERRYAELVGSLPDVVISIDQSLRLTYASDAALEVLGISPSRLVGLSLPSLIADDDRGYVSSVLEGMRSTPGKAETIVCEFVRGDGATRFMQLKLKSSAAKDGADDSPLSGVVRDIHEQQVLARKLDQEMALLSSIFQSTGAHILMLDRDESIIMANHSVRALLDLDEHKIIGMSYRAIKDPGLDARVVEKWRAASGSERLESVEFEKVMLDNDGKTHILRVTANPVQDDHGVLRYIVLIGVDDTQRRQAEIRLFDASRLANLGEMASGVAHEINQPLAVIRLAAESVVEELEMGPDVDKIPAELLAFFKQKLERIAAQTERASGIIRDLRTVARQPGNEAHPFDLSEAVRVGCDLLQEQMRLNRVQFALDLPKPGPRVMGEAGRVQQVVINLVNNARDALIERGAGKTATEGGQIGRIDVRIAIDPATRRVLLIVEDDGPGIPAHVLPRLFEPFFTTKPVGKGTGLGLSISYDIVHRMGGEMSAENRPDGGARFKIGFPPALAAAAEDLRPAA
jgi:PAS domain S-box-containing protein